MLLFRKTFHFLIIISSKKEDEEDSVQKAIKIALGISCKTNHTQKWFE